MLDLIKTIVQDKQSQGGYRNQGGYGQQQRPVELTANLIEAYRTDIVDFLRGLKVTIEIPGQSTSRRTQRINGLVKCPRDNIFDHNGNRITVEQYYRLEKRYTIKYPTLHCLWVGGRDKNIHVPLEVS